MNAVPYMCGPDGNADGICEDRLCRLAELGGYMLRNSRRRYTDAMDYDCYWTIDPSINGLMSRDSKLGLTLDDAEGSLTAN